MEGKCSSPEQTGEIESLTPGIHIAQKRSSTLSAKPEKIGFQQYKYLKLSVYLRPQGLISMHW